MESPRDPRHHEEPRQERPESRYERPIAREEPRDTGRYYSEGGVALGFTDLVRWGPILGGFAATISLLIVLGTLGTAIGATAADGVPTAFGLIWGVVTLVVAFFVGGWVAARTSAVGGWLPAVINSSIVWAFTLLFSLFLAALGVVGLLGVAQPFFAAEVGVTGAAAWWAFFALLVGLASAIAGGLVGMHPESNIVRR